MGRDAAGSCRRPSSQRSARSKMVKGTMQRRAAQGAMGGCCGPLASLELHQAPRSARRETVKGRDAAAICASRDTPKCSGARLIRAAGQL